MTIHVLRALKDNFIFVLSRGLECAVVDPGEAGPVRSFVKGHGLRVTHILCTHHHMDHIGGVAELKAEFGCEVWSSAYDSSRIPGVTRAVGGAAGQAQVENQSAHGSIELEVLGEPLRVLELPGHTLGQIAYYFPRLKAVFPGDTLFSAGCGRLFEGTPEQMFLSLSKLKALPPDTAIYFGHEYTLRNLEFVRKLKPSAEVEAYFEKSERRISEGLSTVPSTLATELAVNPFLQAKDIAEFAEWRRARDAF